MFTYLPFIWLNALSTLDTVGLIVSLTGLFFAFTSLAVTLIVFSIVQKNYYQRFLHFLRKKEAKIKKKATKRGIKNLSYAEYLIDDLKFFGETFFVDFSSDGYLKFYQYRTIKGIYKHLRERLIITEKIFSKALKNPKHPDVIIRIQLFNNYNALSELYFQNQLKNKKMIVENPNAYATIKLHFNHEKKTLENENQKKPSSLFVMESDFEFKKKMYYIFSKANKIQEKLDEEESEKEYFFVACSVSETHQHAATDQQLEKQEAQQEAVVEKEEKETLIQKVEKSKKAKVD